jgi:hypothetical protein
VLSVLAVWIFNSDGFYFIDDSSHYNYNRHFFTNYDQSTGSWHRMGRVLLYALPARLGLKGVQIASAVIFILTIYFAYRILKLKQIPHAEWIIPLLGFQPVLFNISYTTLAELPAAFLIILSYYFYLKDKPSAALLSSSLIFLFRTEYFYVTGIFFLIYLYRKNYRVLPLAVTGPLIWYVYTTVITMNPLQFFHDMTLHARLEKIDTGIDWNYYLLRIPKIYGIPQTIFSIAALVITVYRNKFNIIAMPLLFFITGIFVHTLLALKGLDLTCSIGQLRYVAVVGPVFGLISATGAGYFFNAIKTKILYYIMSVLLFITMFIFGPYSTPFHKKFEIEKVSEEIARLAESEYKDYVIISNLHQLANALDEPQTGGRRFKTLSEDNVRNHEKAIIVWCHYLEGSPFVEQNLSLKEIESIENVKLIREYQQEAIDNCMSIPLYRLRQNTESESIREFIDYMIADQTSWEEINIKIFQKSP